MRPRRPANAAFAAFSVLYGCRFVAVNLFTAEDPLHLAALAAAAAFGVAAAVAVVRVALVFPAPLTDRRALLLPTVVALALVLVSLPPILAPSDHPVARAQLVAFVVTMGAVWTAVLVYARRASEEAARDPSEASRFALVASGLVAYPALAAGTSMFAPPIEAWAFASVAVCIGAASYWLRMTRHVAFARTARNVALFTLALPLAGLVFDVPGILGIVRFVGIAVLAYAILKHQLLGIDVRLRWTISKSTVAAAFIAVFFVAGEGAQLLFGADNQFVGLVAAGALVFAMAPLQRAADRLAERAVPVAGDASAGVSRNEAAYRDALRVALRDRALTRDEELALSRLADALGLTPSRTLEIRHAVETDLAGGGAA